MLWAALATVKLRITSCAAPKVAFPPWLAVMEQVPAAITVRVVPETVHTGVVVDAKVTARPELAVAERVDGATPKVTPLNALKVIVCEDWTVKPCGTVGAAV